ncbi:MAG TPA: glycosyl hydrolase, partial [Candidatus Aminicenantes bacterium]|nr:glycosyl hydrolase [Candidatus Aminicenantes bacterium]
MKRRKFLAQAWPAALAAAPPVFGALRAGRPARARSEKMSPRTEDVKRAMLAMQRDAWEQGTAAQALLEMGETEEVILMAKEAAVR